MKDLSNNNETLVIYVIFYWEYNSAIKICNTLFFMGFYSEIYFHGEKFWKSDTWGCEGL